MIRVIVSSPLNPSSPSVVPGARPGRFDPWVLAALVVLTRLPFRSTTIFSNDAVGDAMAIFHWDFAHEAPHLPGSVMHVGLAGALYGVLGDLTSSFLTISITVSMLAMVLLYFVMRRATSVPIARAASLVWLVQPFFWFQGVVTTSYPYEAFFLSLVLLLGSIALSPRAGTSSRGILIALAGVLALSGAARPTLMCFLAPFVLCVAVFARPSRSTWFMAFGLYAVITAAWVLLLVSHTGGLAPYLALVYRPKEIWTRSALLQGTLASHAAMFAKYLIYAGIGTSPFWTLYLWRLLRHKPRFAGVSRPLQIALLVLIIPQLIFYSLFFYENVGYLTQLFVCSMFASALLWNASPATPRAINVWSATWGAVWLCFFLAPIPGITPSAIHRQHAIASVYARTFDRFRAWDEAALGVAAKVFMPASYTGVIAEDQAHQAVLDGLSKLSSQEASQTVIAMYWGYWPALYRPQSTVLDVQGTGGDRSLSVRRWHEHQCVDDTAREVVIPPGTRDVALIIWHEHPLFPSIAAAVHLEQIPSREYFDLYRITDEHFRLTVDNVTFVR